MILPWNLKAEVMQQLEYIQGVGREVRDGGAASGGGMKPRIYYTKPSITELEVAYATDAARNGWGERCYEYINRFEDAFKDHLGVSYAIATSSCTGALHMGMAALGSAPATKSLWPTLTGSPTAAPDRPPWRQTGVCRHPARYLVH